MKNQSMQEVSSDILLSQWQTCVEMADSVSQRRDSMNNLFVTLNLGLIAAVSFIWEIKSVFLLIAGLIICVLWCLFIRNFKQLNTEKYAVINNIEKKLPVKPFTDEWKRLNSNKKYTKGTTLEFILPVMFILLYIVAIVSMVLLKTKCGGT